MKFAAALAYLVLMLGLACTTWFQQHAPVWRVLLAGLAALAFWGGYQAFTAPRRRKGAARP
jgi:hypothetical protein